MHLHPISTLAALLLCGATAMTQDAGSFGSSGSLGTAQREAQIDDLSAATSSFQMARFDGPLVAWGEATENLVLPIGARVMFEYTLDADHDVVWTGAELVDVGPFGSAAELRITAPGDVLVQVEAFDVAGTLLDSRSTSVHVVSAEAFVAWVASGAVDTAGVYRRLTPEVENARSATRSPGAEQDPLLGVTGGVSPGTTGLSNPAGIVPGSGIGPGSYIPGGGSSGGGCDLCPPTLCYASRCELTVDDVTDQGENSFKFTLTITNHGKCKDSFKIFGSPPAGDLSWAFEPYIVKALEPGQSKTVFWNITTFVNGSSQTLPSHVYFDLYAIGSHTPVPQGGGLVYDCLVEHAIDICFDCDHTVWLDLGGSLPGAAGAALLASNGGLVGGEVDLISLSNAAPNSVSALFLALSSIAVPFKGGTLLAFPILGNPIFLITSPTGSFDLPFPVPVGVPSGAQLYLQFAVLDAGAVLGTSLSNAICGTFP